VHSASSQHPAEVSSLLALPTGSSNKDSNRYSVQLVLEGHAFVKPKHEEGGKDTIGLDIGPSTLAIVPRRAKADLVTFCQELSPNASKKRRLQRKMDRQRRANNPDNYDEKGRVKKGRRTWKESKRYSVGSLTRSHDLSVGTVVSAGWDQCSVICIRPS
jgi:hypothetical protein